ncbi:MAG TPA: hypothetical protein VKS24_13110 [Bradyrhizobium sp.]|nr:hypothetical protein [Bradyrhizobium sp.]
MAMLLPWIATMIAALPAPVSRANKWVVGSFEKTLRTTPAMAANVAKRLWEVGDIVDVLEAWEAHN